LLKDIEEKWVFFIETLCKITMRVKK